MKIEQIAFGTTSKKAKSDLIENLSKFGWKTWSNDRVEATGIIFGVEGKNSAELSFNYDFGLELEILTYIDGLNWHGKRNPEGKEIFLSHLGLHVSAQELETIKLIMEFMGIGIAQEVYTDSHTNPVIKGKRKYHYVVFDSEEKLGFDLKLIERIML